MKKLLKIISEKNSFAEINEKILAMP